MTRRQQLTEVQIAALFDAPTEQRELVRHYTCRRGSRDDPALPWRSSSPRTGTHALLSALSWPVPPQNLIRHCRATMVPLIRRGAHGLAMAKSDPTSGSGARGPCCGMRSPPPSSGDPAALKVETSAVRSVGSIALGLPFPILAAMARGAGPCSGRDLRWPGLSEQRFGSDRWFPCPLSPSIAAVGRRVGRA